MTSHQPPPEIFSSRHATVGSTTVRRALPQRRRRTVGPWCFADHIGSSERAAGESAGGVGPHPHIGLQTVTWLLRGSLLHRDSLGTEQEIRPGQLNLMTAGRGVSHAEESTDRSDSLHGIQLWVAQPDATRFGPPAFEHHGQLPQLQVETGVATVLVGTLGDVTAPSRRDTDHVGAEVLLDVGRSVVPVLSSHEHAVVVLDGSVSVNGAPVTPGQLAHLPVGLDEITFGTSQAARLMILGGEPFPDIKMWWNYVGRSEAELVEANADWISGHERFGETGSPLSRIEPPRIPWY